MTREVCARCGGTGWQCEQHPHLRWPHDECAGPSEPCEEPGCQMSDWLEFDEPLASSADEDDDDI